MIGRDSITFIGELAPGPDYKLYLSPEFVETEADFERLKERMVRVGDVKTFENFLVPLPESVDPSRYNTVIICCESFAQFITAASYRSSDRLSGEQRPTTTAADRDRRSTIGGSGARRSPR